MSDTTNPASAEPGAAVVSPVPNVIGTRRGELDDTQAVERGDVVVQSPAQALIELLGSVDVGHGDDHDLEVQVDLPDRPVEAGHAYFGGTHGCLLVCVGCICRI
jgi:hypothetical protein